MLPLWTRFTLLRFSESAYWMAARTRRSVPSRDAGLMPCVRGVETRFLLLDGRGLRFEERLRVEHAVVRRFGLQHDVLDRLIVFVVGGDQILTRLLDRSRTTAEVEQ